MNCPRGKAEIRENYGFSRREVRRIRAVLMDHQGQLCEVWEIIHGNA